MRLAREVLREVVLWPFRELGLLGNLFVFVVLPSPIVFLAHSLGKNPLLTVAIGIALFFTLFSAVSVGRIIGIRLTERKLALLFERLKGLAEDMHEMTSPHLDGVSDGSLSEPSIDFQYLQLIDDVSTIYAPRFTALEARIAEIMHAVEDISPQRPSTKGMTEKRRRRAYLFKQIKDANPNLSYAQVAMRANQDYGRQLEKVAEEHDVRNDYRDMGWAWEQGDRVR